MLQPKDLTVTVITITIVTGLSKNRLLQVDTRGWIIMLMYLLKTQLDMFIDDDTKLYSLITHTMTGPFELVYVLCPS